MTEYMYLGGWLQEPGEYRAGFGLAGAAGHQTFYDLPHYSTSQPIPGGPLLLTITAD